MPRIGFFKRKNVRVTTQPNIGLDASTRQSVVDLLKLILADETVLSLQLQHADGTSAEQNISELEPLYKTQSEQIDGICYEIGERIQILGGSHLSSAAELIDSARLGGDLNAIPGIVNILADHEAFIRFLREDARKCSEIYEDLSTFALLVSVMGAHEKMAWVLRRYIATEQLDESK